MCVNIKLFKDIRLNSIASVGGKNASLGEMYNSLTKKGIAVPYGFATTAQAYWNFLEENDIKAALKSTLNDLETTNYSNLDLIGAKAREYILQATFSEKFKNDITNAYKKISSKNQLLEVAVRSSATAEDLPNASFAGQHDSFLNVKGEYQLLMAIKKCFASLYTNRAIKYREDKGFKHEDVALSVGIQYMVRSDQGCSGVGFTLDPESGFDNVILLSGVWGLGENMVQGTVNPDEYIVFKPTLRQGFNAIIQKTLGDKRKTMIYSTSEDQVSTMNIDTPKNKQIQYVLSDEEIHKLAKWCVTIETHFKKPMDIEWAKDGINGKLYIIQARPETIHKKEDKVLHIQYRLIGKGEVLVTGNAIGQKITHGKVRLLGSPAEADKLGANDIIVTEAITPDWDPFLKKVSAIITNKGGRTSHAAIVSRELGIPAIVGCINATTILKNNQDITVSCASGHTGQVYSGLKAFEKLELDFSSIKNPKTEAKLILADPEKAFDLSFYPNDGVGLLRMEFIITHLIKIHPMALVNFNTLKDKQVISQIKTITKGYSLKKDYFIDKLSQGLAKIAAAFFPKEVIVRFSDFKTNEYANLIGGRQFEPIEDNPMLGFRGASRYYHEAYKLGFELECQAIKKLRDNMGFTNVKVMIPFCRTLEEGNQVIKIMKQYGLEQGKNNLEIYCMIEVPSNVILAEEFAKIFDGFSIGSNDLTQLTLGVDRDSGLISNLFNENNLAVKTTIASVIETAKKTSTKIGLCGQAPSDFPNFTAFLVNCGIDSISFNPDALIQGIVNINKAEN
ncbi:phosphoenolpyruvate synthase [Mangrovimonas spongiae]|uniref:Phosphoenolpyruvate synthase n=1 Tax=Mangrovimonas spongiae TaxID=2494697 RepID=A0A428K4R0_9FLAO|nr:phosphoenolpyruvate synthase [Mangrovimonas spongiae]RSK41399.1 phosphoenolpyruvate synthase [Mangrovimonas spongiae]